MESDALLLTNSIKKLTIFIILTLIVKTKQG